ncbi:MAG: hypothetical protein ACRD10_09240, partial [Terriglobia bacterium]
MGFFDHGKFSSHIEHLVFVVELIGGTDARGVIQKRTKDAIFVRNRVVNPGSDVILVGQILARKGKKPGVSRRQDACVREGIEGVD